SFTESIRIGSSYVTSETTDHAPSLIPAAVATALRAVVKAALRGTGHRSAHRTDSSCGEPVATTLIAPSALRDVGACEFLGRCSRFATANPCFGGLRRDAAPLALTTHMTAGLCARSLRRLLLAVLVAAHRGVLVFL